MLGRVKPFLFVLYESYSFDIALILCSIYFLDFCMSTAMKLSVLVQ